MIIKTKYLGEKDVNPDDIIMFDEGLPGFEQRRKYVLLKHYGSPIHWLQSIEDEKLAFAVIPLFEVYPDFKMELTDADMEDLQLSSLSEALILIMLVIPPDPMQITANLQAPLVINRNNKKGRQIILANASYRVKHYFLPDYIQYREKKKGKVLANAN